MSVIAWLALQAHAQPVVWLVPPEESARSTVAQLTGGDEALSPLALRSAATAWSPEDEDRLDRLSAALTEVRSYETKLDGELVIMQDLQGPIDSITVLRNDDDRQTLFAALAYQGFAINRFFDVDLATDPSATSYRIDLNGLTLEGPWVDAVALEPDRDVTPYEIAEAPQRVAYGRVRAALQAALPGSLLPVGLPEEGLLVVDGRPTERSAAGNVRVSMGRHLVHAEVDGAIVARWDVDVEPGGQHTLNVDLDDESWNAWLGAVKSGAPGVATPVALRPHLAALGGTVWVVTATDSRTVDVAVVDLDGLERRQLKRQGVGGGGPSEADGPLSVTGAVQLGWLSSGNFYTDDPVNQDASFGTVNTAQIALSVGADYTLGWLRAGAGVDVITSFGSAHRAYVGAGSTPFRLYPHVAVGIPWAQATAGFALPHHPTVGLRGSVPLADGLEIRAHALAGLGGKVSRENTDWERLPLYAAGVGIGYRFGL